MSNLETYKFNALYDMSSGISSSKDQAGHGYPFVSFSTVFNNYFLPTDIIDLMDTSDKERITYSLKKGDILITRTSETIDELAMSSVALQDYPNTTYSGFTKRLRPNSVGKNKVYSKYIAFYLRSKLFRKSVTSNAFMTLRASFNEDIFSFLDLYLPEYEEQRKIGDFLYSINQKIQNNKKIIAELEEMAKTIYDYWFTQFDFPNDEGNPYKSSGGKMVYNAELKRDIPEGWEVKKLAQICNVISGYAFQSDDYSAEGSYKLLTIKNVKDTGIDTNVDNYIKNLPEKIPEYCLLEKFDILMSLTGNVGRVGLNFENNCLLNQRVAVIKPLDSLLNSYLYLLFKSKDMRITLETMATGTSQKNLSPIETEGLKRLYSEPVMISFSQYIDPTIKNIVEKLKENTELTSLRDWLLPMLMNGQAVVE